MKLKRILPFIAFLLFINLNLAKAQNWGGGIDDEQFNWGFNFQYLSSEYKIWKTANWRTPFPALPNGYGTDSLKAISSPASPGFAIGFVANRKITNNLDLRITPSLAFSDRKVLYDYVLGEPVTKKLKSTMVEFPIGLKLKSDRLMNFRTYIIGGIKYGIDIASSKKTNNTNITDELLKNLLNKKNYLSYEAGVGFDIYFEYFKMSPEIKMSYAFKDLIKHEGNAFDTPIDRAKLRQFTFSLFFE
ncbi:MAG: outer membrane beta-barrel protein [Bacteroidota bacterium]